MYKKFTAESFQQGKTSVLVRTLPVIQKAKYIDTSKGKAMKNNFVMTNTAVREHSGNANVT